MKCPLSPCIPPQSVRTLAQCVNNEEHLSPPTSKGTTVMGAAAVHDNVIRIPRLNIPTFSGDILSLEPFRDNYDVAVHSNTTLSDVQKLTYLRSQLQGSAAQVISGFTLNGRNYESCLSLLKDRFGKPHNLKHAHMQALPNLPSPTDTLNSLQEFYDTVEGHVRSLTTLWKKMESCGDLLVTVIRSRLPPKIWKSIAWDHGSGEWTLEAMQAAIKKEIQIRELEVKSPQHHPHPTASFLTAAGKTINKPPW